MCIYGGAVCRSREARPATHKIVEVLKVVYLVIAVAAMFMMLIERKKEQERLRNHRNPCE